MDMAMRELRAPMGPPLILSLEWLVSLVAFAPLVYVGSEYQSISLEVMVGLLSVTFLKLSSQISPSSSLKVSYVTATDLATVWSDIVVVTSIANVAQISN